MGERLVDERRLSGMTEDEFIELALRKHRHPKRDNVRRCLWSNEQLSSKVDNSAMDDDREGWSLFQRQELEMCYVEVEARQWKDPDRPDSEADGSDLVAVDLTIVFDGGRTEQATRTICGGTNSWLQNELAVAANFFLSVEQEEDDMYGPLPPRIPTKEQHNERNKEQLVRWQYHCKRCGEQAKRPRSPEHSYHPLLYSEPLPRLNQSLDDP